MTLKSDMVTDLAAFFDADAFAVIATVKGVPVTGIFYREYVEVQNIAGERPVLVCRTADVAVAAQYDAVVVSGTSYRIRAKEHDGTGVTKLVLEEV